MNPSKGFSSLESPSPRYLLSLLLAKQKDDRFYSDGFGGKRSKSSSTFSSV
jgi:hypothetical protein